MRIAISTFMLAGLTAFSFSYAQAKFTVPKGKVSIESPKDGETVSSPVKVVMKSTVKIRPAGQDPNDHSTGHHHLIIDGAAVPAGQVVPTDETHLHFGKGQTEAEVKLTPGDHTITMQLADGAHRSYGPALSQTVHVHVK
jgi:hypothetical protein